MNIVVLVKVIVITCGKVFSVGKSSGCVILSALLEKTVRRTAGRIEEIWGTKAREIGGVIRLRYYGLRSSSLRAREQSVE